MDIAISRPVALKPVSGQGLIPPPPAATPSQATETLAENQPEIKTTSFTSSSNITTPIATDTSTINSNIATNPTATLGDPCKSEIMIDSHKANSSEHLIQIDKEMLVRSRSRSPSLTPSLNLTPSPKPSPAPSPKCLRPYRKIDDVTTVKRQPKTGWL